MNNKEKSSVPSPKEQKSLVQVLCERQRIEEQKIQAPYRCFFCSYEIPPSSSSPSSPPPYLFSQHLSQCHGFEVGSHHSILMFWDMMDHIRYLLDNVRCVYCLRLFKNHTALKKHMKEKKHRKIDNSSTYFSPFFVINYLDGSLPLPTSPLPFPSSPLPPPPPSPPPSPSPTSPIATSNATEMDSDDILGKHNIPSPPNHSHHFPPSSPSSLPSSSPISSSPSCLPCSSPIGVHGSGRMKGNRREGGRIGSEKVGGNGGVRKQNQDENEWEEWEEEEREFICLFCEESFSSGLGWISHAHSKHPSFKLGEWVGSGLLSFYDYVKLINYYRTCLLNAICVTCGQKFDGGKELERHMKENSHYSPPLPFGNNKAEGVKYEWQNEKFLVPVLEEDPLLLSLFDELIKDEDEDEQ